MMSCVCHAEDVTIRFDGTKVKVKNLAKDSVNVAVRGANVEIESLYKSHKLTLLLIGLNIAKDEPIMICDASGKCLDTITIPFSLRRSASLVTCPAFKLGNTYTVKAKDYEKTFTLNETFTTVR